MSRQAKGQKVGAAFFPFLAVLICTMGALIVLLVLLVQHTRVDSAAIVATKNGGQAGDDRRVRERLEDAQWQRELLEKSRAEKTEELTEARSRVAHLEEHTQRLVAQAKELLERAQAIDEGKKLREEDKAAARAEAAKLKAEIDKKKDELEKAKKKPQDGQEWYALIPYDGRAGTRRRPIYVECTEFGVVIQPEGILLRAEDFNGPLGPGNPLDSALRAIREHWEKTAGKQAAQPYPLLVVRPSGVVAFGAAKAAISAWDDEWGYELISDDKNLDFGPPDPALNAALSKSVAVSRQRQAAMVAMTPRRFQGEEPLRSFTPEPTIAAGASRYIGGAGGAAGGGASGGSGLGSGLGSGPGGFGGNGTAGSGAGGGNGGQPGGGGMARGGGGYGNGLGTGTGTGGGSGTAPGSGIGGAAGGQAAGMNRGGAGGYGAGGYGTGGTAGAGGYGSASGTGANGNGAAGGSGAGGNGYGSSGTGGSGIPSVTAGLNDTNARQSENLVGRNAASAVGGTGGGGGGNAFPGSATNGGGTGPGGSSYGTGSGSGGSGQAGAGAGGTGQAGGGQFGGSSGGQSPAGSGGGGQSGSTMSDPSSGGGGSSVGSAGGASSGGGSPFGGSSMSAGSSGGMGVPSLNFGGMKNAPSSAGGGGKGGSGSPNSTAKRGKNWALPQTKQNQTGVTRHIRVNLQPDRVVMLPEAGDNRAPQIVKIAPEMTPDDVTHFVNAVQSEVKGWGLAVADGYWKPMLQVEVTPGAERQYLNLETALHGSGIEITRR